MISVVLVMSVDVEVASGPSIEPKDGFMDLKNFLINALNLVVDDQGQRERAFDYISGEVVTVTLCS